MKLPKIKLAKQQQKEVTTYKDGYKKGFKQGFKKGELDTIKRIDKLMKKGEYHFDE